MTSREFMYMNKSVFDVNFLLNRLSSFRKFGIATKRLYVCNPLCTAHTF